MSALCSLFKTCPTADEPVAVFSKQGFANRNQRLQFFHLKRNKTKKLPLFSLGDGISPAVVPAVQPANLRMCREAQFLCQSLDQYSVRCDKEGLSRGPRTVPIHTSSYPNPRCRLECHANDPIALLFKTLKVALKKQKQKRHLHINP